MRLYCLIIFGYYIHQPSFLSDGCLDKESDHSVPIGHNHETSSPNIISTLFPEHV